MGIIRLDAENKIELKDIPVKQLHDLGFIEVKPRVYMKQISENTFLYRDYRGAAATSYAYFKEKRISPYKFKEARAIENVEEHLANMKNLQGYING